MTNRVAMGSARGGQGLFVSQPGYDVLTCDPANLMFSSDSGFLQTFQKGIVNAAPGTTNIPHSYGGYPYCALFTMDQVNGGWCSYNIGIAIQSYSDHVAIQNTSGYSQSCAYTLMTFAT